MRATFTIARRELGAYFNSPVAYVVVSGFLLLSAFLYFNALFLQKQADMRELFAGFWTTLVVAFIAPAITMRLLAEERSNETLELLLTMPVTDWDVVLGKYLAAVGLFGFATVAMGLYGVTVALLGPLDKGPAAAGLLGLFLTGSMFMAIGLMTSSFTKNQLIAWILSAGACSSLWLVGKLLQIVPPSVQPFVDWIVVEGHIGRMARGVIDSRDLLYYGSIIGLCLLITQTTLESRRWR